MRDTADTLHTAATAMRAQHGIERHQFWAELAAWIDNVHFRAYGIGLPVARDVEIHHALKVARAYLGVTDDA